MLTVNVLIERVSDDLSSTPFAVQFITRKYAFVCVKRRPIALRYIHGREKTNICA